VVRGSSGLNQIDQRSPHQTLSFTGSGETDFLFAMIRKYTLMTVCKGVGLLRCLGIAVLLLCSANEGRAAFSCGSRVFTYGVVAPDGSPARGGPLRAVCG
jgi:hypothetical protein